MMRAVTILDGATVDVNTEPEEFALLRPKNPACDVCSGLATQFIICDGARFRSPRCDDHGRGLVDHPEFSGKYVEVQMLQTRHWITYKNGIIQKESFGQ